MRIFLIGFMGSGKSYWGKQLAGQLQWPFYDLDEVIEKNTGKTIREIFETQGEAEFRKMEKESLEQLIAGNTDLIVATGGGTPCFYNNIELMKQQGTVVWLSASLDLICNRLIGEKEKRPLLTAVSEEELKSYVLKKMNDRRIYYEQAQVHVTADDITLPFLLQQLLHA